MNVHILYLLNCEDSQLVVAGQPHRCKYTNDSHHNFKTKEI